MKRLLIMFMVLALALPAFARGGAEKANELVLLIGADISFEQYGIKEPSGAPTVHTRSIQAFQRENPGWIVRTVKVDLSSGSTLTIDALVAAGQAPDLYIDFAGRTGKYMVPEYALPLDPYITDLDKWNPSVLATATRNGKVMGLPLSSWGVALAVNTDLLAEAGAKLPAVKDWTTDAFLSIAEAIKQKLPGKYATCLFAKNQSSDQWWMGWFYAFGARVYAPGDYSRTVLNSPQAAAALRFQKLLVEQGYSPPNPEVLDDDVALDLWAKGKVAMLPMQAGHTMAMKGAVEQGVLAKPFNFVFTQLPHAPGLKSTPAAAGPTLAVAHKSGDAERNRAIARLAWYFANADYQAVEAQTVGGYPSRLDVKVTWKTDPAWEQCLEVINQAGVMDLGITTPTFSEVRSQLFPLMQEFFIGKMTAEQVLATYEKNVNAILK